MNWVFFWGGSVNVHLFFKVNMSTYHHMLHMAFAQAAPFSAMPTSYFFQADFSEEDFAWKEETHWQSSLIRRHVHRPYFENLC